MNRNLPYKILIVDDIKINRVVMNNLVTHLGYFPVLASDGARAIASLEDNPDFACVITDVNMPNINGHSLIHEMRTRMDYHIPIFVVSAHVKPEETESLLKSGANRVLKSPVNKKELEYCLKSVLNYR